MDVKKSPEESKENLTNLNIRKRKISNSDQDYCDKLYPTKKIYSPPVDSYYSSDTQSSTDCLTSTVTAEYLSQLGSPPASVNNILSPIIDEYETKLLLSKGEKTPHGYKRLSWNKKLKDTKCFITPTADLRLCPLPRMSWADSGDVWRLMCRKDSKASLERKSTMLQFHPGLTSRMRAILLDWLIEVCEVYKLHRETYYLAVDYFDRFLSAARITVNKTHLQLIGITCLFIAAKVEEIYPPKMSEFAYVTDSACTEDDITQQELIILKALNWNISTITIMGWLSIYMQVNCTNNRPKPLIQYNNSNLKINHNSDKPNINKNNSNKNNNINSDSFSDSDNNNNSDSNISNNSDSFVYPQFSGMEFVHTAQLLDLCTLDIEIANYPYSVIAAAAISHTFDEKTSTNVSGLEWDEIKSCADWMEPYFNVIRNEEPLFLLETNEQIKSNYGLSHICPNILTDESHILQTHSISLPMFDKAFIREEEEQPKIDINTEASPAVFKCPEGLLTPPASSRKPSDIDV